jgi:histidinol-phosphate aminotransferase
MPMTRRRLLHRIGAGAALAAVPSAARAFTPDRFSLPSATSREHGPIPLNRNVNADGPSPRAIAALCEAARSGANRYPETETVALQKALAELHGVEAEQIVLGCGSSEILRMAVTAFAVGKKVVVATPTFELIHECARAAGANVVKVPLAPNYSHDLDAMLERIDAATGLTYVCNPNNPTGSLTSRRDLESFIRRLPPTAHVLIDEAYHHYVGGSSDYASFIDKPIADHRVMVTRSFSAVYGLAGMRVGYAVADEAVARTLAIQRLPDNLTVPAARAALAALNDAEYVRQSAISNADRRQEFFNQANARMLKPIDSHTNFVMFNTLRPARDVVAHFQRHGILIVGSMESLDKYVRVSLGTPADRREFWRVWDMEYKHAM